MFHVSGWYGGIVFPAVQGATGCSQSTFSASGFLDRVREVGATHSALFGPLAVMLWNQPVREDDSQTPLEVAYGYLPPDLHRSFEQRFEVEVISTYALSEVMPTALAARGDTAPPGTAGRPVPEVEVKVFDEGDNEVPTGEIGEIVVRPTTPYSIFSRYYRNPEATVDAWQNLWFHTGDLGRFDQDGFLSFVDRKADYLRRRGENVSCWEVEQAILTHPDVAEVAVLGVRDEALGEEEVKACVVLVEGARLEPMQFLRFCHQNMPYHAVPRYLEILDDLPRNPIGRVTKEELRRAGNSDSTVDAVALGFVASRT